MKKYLLSIYIITATSTLIHAQQTGTLDTTYGDSGKTIFNSSFNTSAGALQKDQKLIVCGLKFPNTLVLKRYLKDGSTDKEFGNNGVSETSFDSYNLGDPVVVIQPDQRIILTTNGSPISGNIRPNFVLCRFLSDGLVDSSFGLNGKVITTDTGSASYYVSAACLQADGNIVVGGYLKDNPNNIFESFLLKRYLPDGSLDKSFGAGGTVVTKVSFDLDFITALVCQADGKIVAGGLSGGGPGAFDNKFALVRYLKDGKLDQDFGANGKVVSLFNKNGQDLKSLALQEDGKIVAAGTSNISFSKTWYMSVAKYNTDGTLDKAFGENGEKNIIFDGKTAEAKSVTIQNNTKIVLAGRVYNDFTAKQVSDIAIVRVLNDGTVDSTFGTQGRTISDFGDYDYCATSLLQNDGKILCVGQSYSNAENINYNLIARYYGDPIKQLSPIAKKIRRWIRNHTLNWQDNNTHVGYYVIEQSSNGVSAFKEIGRVKANAQKTMNNEQLTYSYNLSNTSVSSQPSSVKYYRVTAVNNGGSNITSDVIADDHSTSISISPNPVKDVMKIAGLPAGVKSTINVVNRNGNVLQSAVSNASIYNINVSQLKSGVYTVQVISNSNTQTVKFVKE